MMGAENKKRKVNFMFWVILILTVLCLIGSVILLGPSIAKAFKSEKLKKGQQSLKGGVKKFWSWLWEPWKKEERGNE